MKKVHVCHVISGYQRNDPRVFQRQCKSMLKFGYKVSILTNDKLPNQVIDEIQIKEIGSKFSNRIFTLLFARFLFLKPALLIDADVYQMHSPELISLGATLKKLGKKVIYDAHEDMPRHILEKHWLPVFFRKIISVYFDLYQRHYLKKYDGIISPHQHVVDDLLRINKNVILITNFAKVKKREFRSFEEYCNSANVLCYSGTCYLHSNQIQILEAIKELEVKYRVAGFISSSLYYEMKNIDNNGQFDFLGRLDWDKLDEFYSSCGIGLVVLDYKMNWGGKKGTFAVNKMFEYMEAALPIICSDYDLWVEVIKKHNCGLYVKPGNISEIRNAIIHLLNNPKQAFLMGQNGRKAVIEEYNWGNEEAKYNIFCSQILAKSL